MNDEKYMIIFLVNDYGCIYPEYEILTVDDIFDNYDFETLIEEDFDITLGDDIEITECIESDERKYERTPMTIVRIQ